MNERIGLLDEVTIVDEPEPRTMQVKARFDGLTQAPSVGVGQRVVRLRRIDPASVLRISLVLCLVFVALALGLLAALWSLARSSGLVDHIEGLARDYGFEDFRFLPQRMFTYAVLALPLLAVLGALACVGLTLVANVVLRVVGGISVTLDEGRSRRR